MLTVRTETCNVGNGQQVWRAALVMLAMHNDKVLDPDPRTAWKEINVLINEEKKPAKDKISNVVREFDPVDSKTMGHRSAEARFSLAAGLAKTIKDTALVREGIVQTLLLQWLVACSWTQALVRETKGLKDALGFLEQEAAD